MSALKQNVHLLLLQLQLLINMIQTQTGARGVHRLRNRLKRKKPMVKELNSIPVMTRRERRIGTRVRTRTETTRMKICATVNVWAHHIGFNKSTSVVVHGSSRGGMTLG